MIEMPLEKPLVDIIQRRNKDFKKMHQDNLKRNPDMKTDVPKILDALNETLESGKFNFHSYMAVRQELVKSLLDMNETKDLDEKKAHKKKIDEIKHGLDQLEDKEENEHVQKLLKMISGELIDRYCAFAE